MTQPELPPEMLQKYVVRRRADVLQLKECLKGEDLSIAERIGHQIKGNGATFGFPELEDLGRKIEFAAKRKEKDQLSVLVTQFEDAVSKMN